MSGARDSLEAFDLRLHSQDVQQDVSAVWANEVEVEVEQRHLRQAGLQGPGQSQQEVVRQVRVPQDQLLHLIGCAQDGHHGVELQPQTKTRRESTVCELCCCFWSERHLQKVYFPKVQTYLQKVISSLIVHVWYLFESLSTGLLKRFDKANGYITTKKKSCWGCKYLTIYLIKNNIFIYFISKAFFLFYKPGGNWSLTRGYKTLKKKSNTNRCLYLI